MSTTVRNTPQTRSQTKKVASTRTSVLGRLRDSSEIPKQTTIITVIATLAILGVLTFAYLRYYKSIIQVPRLPSITDRLIYTLQLQTFTLIPVAISLVQVMFVRVLANAINPLSGNEKVVEKPVRILTNSVEQLLFGFINLTILVTLIPADYLFVIPLLVALVTVGRIAFFIGYNIHPKFRTFGFILAFVPIFSVFIINILYVSGLNKYLSLPGLEQTGRKTEL